jgi:hypothetical protein
MTTDTMRGRRIYKSKNAFGHLLGISGTTAICRFRLLSRRVRNLQ